MIFIPTMVGVNSSKLFDQTPASKNQGKSVMNMSILSSKPPLLDQIKNNFEKILGLGSALIPNSKNREENYNSNSGSPYFYDKIGEPQSSEIRLGEESSSLLNKPPMHPKFASTLKKGLLKPPQMMGVNPSGSKHQLGIAGRMLSNIPKSATLKNVRFKRRSLSNLKNLSFNKSQRSKEGISSANIASDNKSMSGIIEAS